MNTIVDVSELPGIGARIGSGGEGEVFDFVESYKVDGFDTVLKRYRPSVSINVEQLQKIIEFGNRLPARQRQWLLSHAAWPLALVKERSTVIGIIMPRVPNEFFREFVLPSGKSKTGIADLQYLLNSEEFIAARGLCITDSQKYEFLYCLAELLRVLHEGNVVVGDLSAKNVLFRVDESGTNAYLIDCDSMGFVDSPGIGIETPGWNAPAGERGPSRATDEYKFGLIATRVLAGDQSARDFSTLSTAVPDEIRLLASSALSDSPSQRPDIDAWRAPLLEASEMFHSAQIESGTMPPTSAYGSVAQPTLSEPVKVASIDPRVDIKPAPSAVGAVNNIANQASGVVSPSAASNAFVVSAGAQGVDPVGSAALPVRRGYAVTTFFMLLLTSVFWFFEGIMFSGSLFETFFVESGDPIGPWMFGFAIALGIFLLFMTIVGLRSVPDGLSRYSSRSRAIVIVSLSVFLIAFFLMVGAFSGDPISDADSSVAFPESAMNISMFGVLGSLGLALIGSVYFIIFVVRYNDDLRKKRISVTV